MNAAAAAAADFKNGFGSQFNGLMQPFADTDLYSSYSSYNNWAKVPSPLAGAKTFPWTVNAPPVNCFNTGGTGMTSAGSMGLGVGVATAPTSAACPYATPAAPYTMYHAVRGTAAAAAGAAAAATGTVAVAAAAAAADGCNAAMSSSIASLRLKAKQHSSSFVSSYSPSLSPARSASTGLSACQYAAVDRTSV